MIAPSGVRVPVTSGVNGDTMVILGGEQFYSPRNWPAAKDDHHVPLIARFRAASVRSRSALSLMKPAASF